MHCGVYKLTFPNGSFYYGSAIELDVRVAHHRNALDRKAHKNVYMQNVYNKHGAFTAEVVMTCALWTRRMWEQSYIDEFIGSAGCLNMADKAGGGSRKGRQMSDEARAKMSAAAKARSASPEARKILSDRAKQQFADPEVRAKTSMSAKTSAAAIAHRSAIAADPEVKAKRSASLKAAHARRKMSHPVPDTAMPTEEI